MPRGTTPRRASETANEWPTKSALARASILDWRDHEARNEALAMLQQVAFVFIHQNGIATPRNDDRWPATAENQRKVWETLEAAL